MTSTNSRSNSQASNKEVAVVRAKIERKKAGVVAKGYCLLLVKSNDIKSILMN